MLFHHNFGHANASQFYVTRRLVHIFILMLPGSLIYESYGYDGCLNVTAVYNYRLLFFFLRSCEWQLGRIHTVLELQN